MTVNPISAVTSALPALPALPSQPAAAPANAPGFADRVVGAIQELNGLHATSDVRAQPAATGTLQDVHDRAADVGADLLCGGRDHALARALRGAAVPDQNGARDAQQRRTAVLLVAEALHHAVHHLLQDGHTAGG